LYGRIEAQLQATLAPVQGPARSFDEVITYLDRVFGHLWQFRFFYRDLNTLLQQVPGLRDRYRDLFEVTQSNARRIFASMVEAGWLQATPAELDMLATNAWILMSHWFMHCQAASRRRTIQSSDVNDGIRHLVALFSPRLKPAQMRQLRRFLTRPH
ncbi:MAG TPA: TetR/AcrR family transcriptional regulator, partial [Steroidobacteraceae bacterium]|nr:TetR/AcrR family transcriptional regulator [Steroidobacteraceae bacterium]